MPARTPKKVEPTGFGFIYNNETFTIPVFDPSKRDTSEQAALEPIDTFDYLTMPAVDKTARRIEEGLASFGDALRTIVAHLTDEADLPALAAIRDMVNARDTAIFWSIWNSWVEASGEVDEPGESSGSEAS